MEAIIFFLSLIFSIQGVVSQTCLSPKPYARIKSKRSGPNINEIFNSGFMDLRDFTHKLLCINGVAIVYNDTRPGNNDKTTIFTRGALKTYSEQCYVFNQISTSKAIELRNKGQHDVKLTDVAVSDIVGNRFMGVYLISERDSIRATTAVIFLQQNLDYILTNEPGIRDGSFVTIGRGPFCLKMYPKHNTNEIVVRPDATVTDLHVCKWSKSDISDPELLGRYGKIFNGSLTREELEWRDCSGGGAGGYVEEEGLGPGGSVSTTPPTLKATTIDPFSIIVDSKLKAVLRGLGRSSKRGRTLKDSRGRSFQQGKLNNRFANGSGPGGEDGKDPWDFSGDYEIGINLRHCSIQLEPEGECNTTAGINATGEGGELLKAAIGILPDPGPSSGPAGTAGSTKDCTVCDPAPASECPCTQPGTLTCAAPTPFKACPAGAPTPAKDCPCPWTATDCPCTPPTAPCATAPKPDPCPATATATTDSWMTDVLDVASSIFGKICQPFPPSIPFMLARVFKRLYELLAPKDFESYDKVNKRIIWEHLFAELDRCNAAAKPMWWYWDARDDSIPLDEEDDIICLIESCSPGCEPSSKDDPNASCKPSSSGSTDCSTAQVECPTQACIYDAATSSCIEDSSVDPSTLSPTFDCGSDTPSCSSPGCEFFEGSCSLAPCTVSACAPTESCKAGLNKMKCERKNPEKGAYPIDLGGTAVPDQSLLLPDTSLSAADSGVVPTDPATAYPLDEIVITHEIIRPPPKFDFTGYPINVLVITNITSGAPDKPLKAPNANFQHAGSVTGQCLYFYEDMAETNYDLNIAIDIFWKIWATVIGYCNGHYAARKGETFPRLFNTFFEDFILRIQEEWMEPKYNEVLGIILSGQNDEIARRWLDVCLESSYIVSQSQVYRPPRPVTLLKPLKPGQILEPNYFLALPDHLSTKSINLQEVEVIKCE